LIKCKLNSLTEVYLMILSVLTSEEAFY